MQNLAVQYISAFFWVSFFRSFARDVGDNTDMDPVMVRHGFCLGILIQTYKAGFLFLAIQLNQFQISNNRFSYPYP